MLIVAEYSIKARLAIYLSYADLQNPWLKLHVSCEVRLEGIVLPAFFRPLDSVFPPLKHEQGLIFASKAGATAS